MNHSGHDMSGMHAGHDMSGMHAGHTMTGDMLSNVSQSVTHNPHNTDMSGMHNGDHDMSGMHEGHDMSGMHGGHDMSGMGGGMDMPGMKMYFHAGVSEYVLFEDCQTSSTGGLVGACFVVFVAAILYEGLKFLREVLLQRSLGAEAGGAYREKELTLDSSNGETRCSNVGSRMFSSSHFLQTLLHVVQVFVSYCLMLVFMTYNVWLCLAVVLGAGLGYFLFGWKRAVIIDANEHCH